MAMAPNYPLSPYERARTARAIAATTARRTLHYVWRAADAAMHAEDPAIWKPARSQPGHEGSPALQIDVRAHQIMHDTVNGLVEDGPVIFDSEEGALAYIPRAGATMLIADPLDGTTNAKQLGFGYASATVIGWISPDEGFEPAGAAVATLGWVVSWMHLGPNACQVYLGSQGLGVGAGPSEEQPMRDDTERLTWLPRIVPGDAETVALVAASARRRRQAEDMFSFPGPVYCLAGNPLLPKLLRGGVGAVVELNKVALRDGIFLLAHQQLGGLVTDLDGAPIDVYETFRSARQIGPFIAAASGEALDYVLAGKK